MGDNLSTKDRGTEPSARSTHTILPTSVQSNDIPTANTGKPHQNKISPEILAENITTSSSLLNGIASGVLVNIQLKDLKQLSELSKVGYCSIKAKQAYLSKELLSLLNSLLSLSVTSSVKFSFLSLIRHGEGPHGIILPNTTVVCRAIDISMFSNYAIQFVNPSARNKQDALNCILSLIDAMPAGNYTLGFPRPTKTPGVFQSPDPVNDYFLPVRDLKQVENSQPLANIKDNFAKTSILTLLGMRQECKLLICYPDGNNHVHIKACDPSLSISDQILNNK